MRFTESLNNYLLNIFEIKFSFYKLFDLSAFVQSINLLMACTLCPTQDKYPI